MLLSAGIAAFFLFPRSPDVVLQSFVPCNVSLNAQNQLSLDLTVRVVPRILTLTPLGSSM